MVVLAVIIFLHATPRALSQERYAYPTGPDAGRELAADLSSLRPAENTHWRGTLKTKAKGHDTVTVPVECETSVSAATTDWSVTYLAAATAVTGAEKLTIIHSTNGPTKYLYARAATPSAPPGELKPVDIAVADGPFGGSDFWLSDLGFEFYHWPQQNRLKGEMRNSRPCFVLESVNPHPAPGGYTRVLTWIEKESGAPMEAEAYGPDKRVWKEFSLGGAKRINDHWELKEMTMDNPKGKSRTHLEFDLSDKQAK